VETRLYQKLFMVLMCVDGGHSEGNATCMQELTICPWQNAHATNLGGRGKLQLVSRPRWEGVATESRILENDRTAH
jgi:hypothetical protein